ncbi:MAG: DUF6252 family protein [Capnocytophaga sp.]|nr:DUF6252 family protein [Capnocytophaga sp.]
MKTLCKLSKIVIVLIIVIGIGACSKSNKEDETYYFNAIIDGQKHEATQFSATITQESPAVLQLYGSWNDANQSIELYHFSFPKEVGSYTINFPTDLNVKSVYKKDSEYYTKATGILKIETITEQTIKGNFEFKTTLNGKEISVTEGAFYLPITIIPENQIFPNVKSEIEKIIPSNKIEELKANGVEIHSGDTPPNIDGIFVSSPHILMKTYAGDGYSVGHRWPNFIYQFLTIHNGTGMLNYKAQDGSESAEGTSVYMTGSDNKFTIYSRTSGYTNGVPKITTNVLSGEITPTGIKNLKNSYILIWKEGDTSNSKVMPIGAFRISGDSDGLSEKQ